jgi:uncharacterized protein YndB with AHSA1/START domain
VAIEPVRKAITVACTVEHAWAVFTDGIATWWPLRTHSLAEAAAVTCWLEARVGGRLMERTDDGTEHEWGRVVACEPPTRLVVAWQPTPDRPVATEWEIRLSHEGDGTSVVLEHRGWELLGERGGELRSSYDAGWTRVLDLYAARASA